MLTQSRNRLDTLREGVVSWGPSLPFSLQPSA
jgi:hypothetical protein